MSRTAHLTRRRQTWFFRVSVPRDLRAHFGKERIEVSTKTGELKVAQKARAKLLSEALETFERVRVGGPVEFPTTLTTGSAAAVLAMFNERSNVRPRLDRRGGGISVSEAAEDFLKEVQRDPGAARTAQTIGQSEAVFRLFTDFTKDAPLAGIKRATAAQFLDEVAKLDPHWGRGRGVKEKSLSELKYADGSAGLSNKTLNRYASILSSLFKWARRRELCDENPFSDLSRPKGSQGYVPFTIPELNKLFGDCLIDETLRWISLIALFSGMRLGEVCGLRVEDVRQEGGIWLFDVVEHPLRRLKSPAATRIVPLHHSLLSAGLLQLCGVSNAGLLFPDLRPGGPDNKLSWHISKDFTEHRRDVGVDRPRLAFHSFRKNFTTALDQAGVPQADVAALLGHERGFSFDVYSGGPGIERLRDVVEKVHYKGLKL